MASNDLIAAAGPGIAARQRAAATTARRKKRVAARRAATLSEIASLSLTKPPEPPHHGFFGSVVHGPLDLLGLATKQIADVALGIPQGVVESAKTVGGDIGDFVLHGDVTPERTAGMIKESGKQVWLDVTHPLDRPGYLLVDALGIGTGGYGTALRVSRAAAAYRAVATGAKSEAAIAATKQLAYPRPPKLEGGEEFKGKRKSLDAVDYEEPPTYDLTKVPEEGPPEPKTKRGRVIQRAGQLADTIFRPKRPEGELAVPKGEPLTGEHFKYNFQRQEGLVANTVKLNNRFQLGLGRTTIQKATGVKRSGFVYHLLIRDPEHGNKWRHIEFDPSAEERLQAKEAGLDVVTEAPPLFIAYRHLDSKAKVKEIFEKSAAELHAGVHPRNLSITRLAHNEFERDRQMFTEAYQAKLAQEEAGFKPDVEEEAAAPVEPAATREERESAAAQAAAKRRLKGQAPRKNARAILRPYVLAGLVKTRREAARVLNRDLPKRISDITEVPESSPMANLAFNEVVKEIKKATPEELKHPKWKLPKDAVVPERAAEEMFRVEDLPPPDEMHRVRMEGEPELAQRDEGAILREAIAQDKKVSSDAEPNSAIEEFHHEPRSPDPAADALLDALDKREREPQAARETPEEEARRLAREEDEAYERSQERRAMGDVPDENFFDMRDLSDEEMDALADEEAMRGRIEPEAAAPIVETGARAVEPPAAGPEPSFEVTPPTAAQKKASEKALAKGKGPPKGKAPTKKVGYRPAPLPEGATALEAAIWTARNAEREYQFKRQHEGDPKIVAEAQQTMLAAQAELERVTAREGEAPAETFAEPEPTTPEEDLFGSVEEENPFDFGAEEPVAETPFTVAPREKAPREPSTAAGVGDLAIRHRQLREYGAPEEKLQDLQRDLRAAQKESETSGVDLDDRFKAVFKIHLGKGPGAAAYKKWKAASLKGKPKPSAGGEVSMLPGQEGAAIKAAMKAFFGPHPAETRLLGYRQRVVDDTEQTVPMNMELSRAPVLKGLQNALITAAERLTNGQPLKNERLAKTMEQFRLPKAAAAYLKRKKRITSERGDALDNALEIGEKASSFKDPLDRLAYLAQIVERRTNENKDKEKWERGLDELNMLSSIGVLYLKLPAFLIPNLIGQVSILASDAGLNPFAVAHANRLIRGLQDVDPEAFDTLMHGMGQGLADQARGAVGTTGRFGDVTRASYGFMSKMYGRVLDEPFRAAALGLELKRQGFNTPEKASELFRDHANRGRMMDVVSRANSNAIDYTKMGKAEKKYARRLIFFYPWIKAATRYGARFPFHHPAQMAALAQTSQIGQKRTEELLPELPSYLQGVIPGPDINIPLLGNLAYEDIPGVGRVPRVFNPRAATVLGQTGDVMNMLQANFLSGDIPSAARFSQLFNPTVSTGVGVATGVDPFTNAPYPAGTTVPGIIGQEAAQLIYPKRLYDMVRQSQQVRAGTLPGVEDALLPRTPSDVGGTALFGTGPVPINPSQAERLAFGEQTGTESKSRRVILRAQRTREQYADAAMKTGILQPGQQLPQAVRDALTRRAERDANIAGFEEQVGHQLNPLERLHADLNLIVRQGRMPAATASRLEQQLASAPDSVVRKAGNAIRLNFFNPAVVSQFKAYLNTRLEAIGEAPLTV